jgi:hypothetical protein
MVAVPQGTESLDILDPSDQRNELKKKRLKPDAGAIGRVQGVSFRVDEAVRKDAAIDLAKQRGKIR